MRQGVESLGSADFEPRKGDQDGQGAEGILVALASEFWGLGCPRIYNEVATLSYGFMPFGMWLVKKMVSAHSGYKKRLDWVAIIRPGNGYTSYAELWLGQVAIN